MSDWQDCGKCNAKGTMAYAGTWEGFECVSCGYTTSSYIICPECKGDQRIGTPACGCGTCKACGYRVSCMPVTVMDEMKIMTLNPPFDTLNMGTAGASIEREAHTKTLDLLRRARDLLTSYLYHTNKKWLDNNIRSLLDDIRKQCPIFAEEDVKGLGEDEK